MPSHNITQIINQASNLTERLSSAWVVDTSAASLALAEERLATWCQLVAQGNGAQFEQRLALDGLSHDTARAALGHGSFKADVPMPVWAEILQAILIEPSPLPDPCFEATQPVPFEELLSPFVAWARRQTRYTLSDEAHLDLEYRLLTQLAAVAGQSFLVEFSLFLARHQSLCDISGNSHYQAFVSEMRQGGLQLFYQKYSTLARLLATLTQHWLDTMTEFQHRLQADWSALEQTFGALGQQVEAVEAGLSDPHHQGRTVMAVTFESGLTVAYKPRSLDLDAAWYGLLGWCNEQGITLPFKSLRFLNRADYGWLEWVSADECPDMAAVERYYQRCGLMLCLIHLLEGTDCHAENIIAHGEQPILIDPEMLLSPRVPTAEAWPISVKRTAFLPDENLPDSNFMAGLSETVMEMAQVTWQAINQDPMRLTEQLISPEPYHNLPRLHGVRQKARDYVSHIQTGFQTMYLFLRHHRHALPTVLAPFKSLVCRFANRHTQSYGQLLQNLNHPTYLRHGIDRSLQMERMGSIFLRQKEARHFWPLFLHERAALEQLDIPHFITPIDSDSLTLPDQNLISHCFISSSYEQIFARCQSLMSEAELTFQLDLIANAFKGPQPRLTSVEDRVKNEEMDADLHRYTRILKNNKKEIRVNQRVSASNSGLFAQAIIIGQELAERAIHLPNGQVTWLTPVYQSEMQSYRSQFMGDDLYEGRAGVALFLAALAQMTATTHPDWAHAWRELALNVADHLTVESGEEIYVLVRLSQFLADPNLLRQTHQFAQTLALQTNQSAGVLEGLAGTLLGLLTLHLATNDATMLAHAVAYGEQLLHQRQLSATGQWVWAAPSGQFLTGFSHGSAGIGAALWRLYQASHDSRFLDAAQEAMAYERAVFSVEAQNWPDLRGDSPVFGASWCNGAAGMALARLSSLAIMDNPTARQELTIALESMQRYGWTELDTLCCGSFGQIEVLLQAGLTLNRSDWVAKAYQQAEQLIAQRCESGYYQLFDDLPPPTYQPSFFRGLSGIGYTLLRLVQAHPMPTGERLPCVLQWE